MYNSLTSELLLLNEKEFESLLTNKIKEERLKLYMYLVQRWFLVPEDVDEYSMFSSFNKTYIDSHRKHSFGPLRNITILTTTKCNANCPYCYEYGLIKKDMNYQTSIDVANFIKSHCDSNLRLNWFGGEPLYNGKVIETICNELSTNNINYYSTITSNGFLFDQFDIVSMKELWKLKDVQITLDGTDEVYNDTKKYIYKDVNAFEKVIKNIKLLLDNNIYVNIRLNLSLTNFKDLMSLVDLLHKEFRGYNNICIYPHPLYENEGKDSAFYTENERKYIYDKYIQIEKYVREIGMGKSLKLPQLTASHCMADNMYSAVITPDGNLTLCEHHADDEILGNIYDNKLDYNILNNWKEREESDECKTCCFLPQCIKLKMCPAESKCSKEERDYKDYIIKRNDEKAYQDYKTYKT